MATRIELIQGIADIISDYRAGEVQRPDAEHVERWIDQFPANEHVPILGEMQHVLNATYLPKVWVEQFLGKLLESKNIAGEDPCAFWKRANFLDIQIKGNSQREMLPLFNSLLKVKCGLNLKDCGAADGPFIYLDDAVFSGNRIAQDVKAWIQKDAPPDIVLHIIVAALYAGSYRLEKNIEAAAAEAGKKIKVTVWRAVCLENRKSERSSAEVLWPSELPDDDAVKVYAAAQKYGFEPRPVGGKLEHAVFSSEEGRQVLERTMLVAGVQIRNWCRAPKDIVRPLGYSPFSVGFGATIVTYRNCPNNCPLAWWWGDPNAHPSHPFSKWYPLLPRKTYDKDHDLLHFG